MSGLMRDARLEALVTEYLGRCGHPELAPLQVVWNPRLRTTAGVAKYRQKTIHLNPALQRVDPEEVDRTLRHELAHFVAQHRHGRVAHHGPEWRRACADLGIPGEDRCHNLELGRRHRLPRKFFYRCPNCGKVLARVRPLTRPSACLSCCRLHHGGRYTSRFRLAPCPPPETPSSTP